MLRSSVLLPVLFALASPLLAQAHEESDACGPVFEGCAAQGFEKDDSAPAGKKIWLNCANVIINQKKSVPKVDIDPNGFDAKNCRDYRTAKAKFDADWAKKHQKHG